MSGRSTPQTHGLPARPPPPTGSGNYGASFAGFKPRSVAPAAAPPSYAQAPQYNNPYDMNAQSAATSYTGYYQPAPAAQQYGAPGNYGSQDPYAQAPPQMHNPFAKPSSTPGHNGSMYGGYDAEEAAQIQQWQSQYNNDAVSKIAKTGQGEAAKAGNANHTPLGNNKLEGSGTTTSTTKSAAAAATAEPTKQKTVVRQGGGQSWEDETLLEWGNHHRLFVGNLAGEVTDESLLKAFSKFPSVQKARVVRDKRTTKSKGFGFVSLADADEYFQAAKEMQGKYIGSHPVLISRANADIKATNKKDKGRNDKYRGKGKGDSGKKDKDGLGANTGGGVGKKGKMMEGKYKVLG